MAATSRTIDERRRRGSNAWPVHAERQWLLVALVAFLALNGIGIVYGGLLAARSAALQQGFETSFGTLHVTTTEVIGGLSPGDVGGMTHGLAGYVPAEQAELVVAVRIANTSDRPVRLEPDEFTLRRDGVEPIKPAGGTLSSTVLEAGASLEARLSFVIPRDVKAGTLAFTEANGASGTIAVGPFDAGAASFEPNAPHAH